jgi:hypothetical protein
MKEYVCELCGTPIPDYKPEYCCDGKDCGCQGQPIEPPWCDKCWDEVMGIKENDYEYNR